MGAQTSRLKRPPEVVLDTNVLVSALIFGGKPWRALRMAWQSGRIVPIVNRHTVEELLAVFAYPKFKLGVAERETLLADYLPFAQVVAVPDEMRKLPILRDPEDLMLLALAVTGKADVLVSGDADLLAVRDEWRRIPILTPAEFGLRWNIQED